MGTTLVLDTTALIMACMNDPRQATVASAMTNADVVVASERALPEALAAAPRICDDPYSEADLADALCRVNDRVHIATIDSTRLHHASTLARQTGMRLSAALHISTALMCGPDTMFATFDPNQIAAAVDLGLSVVST